jgi:hypothetical protein
VRRKDEMEHRRGIEAIQGREHGAVNSRRSKDSDTHSTHRVCDAIAEGDFRDSRESSFSRRCAWGSCAATADQQSRANFGQGAQQGANSRSMSGQEAEPLGMPRPMPMFLARLAGMCRGEE